MHVRKWAGEKYGWLARLSFYQYIYRSNLSSYVRVAIVYLAIFFSRPTEQEHAVARAMIESSENVHYIELSNLWVGTAQGAACAHAYCALYTDV